MNIIDVLKNAPLDDESLTDEELKELEKARLEILSGEYFTTEELEKELGLNL